MAIVKVIYKSTVQVALTSCHRNPQATSMLVNTMMKLVNTRGQSNCNMILARPLTQSTQANQKVTNANQQQLIPIARNISFRQCQNNQLKASRASAKASYSVAAANPVSQFVETWEILDPQSNERLSPLESLKKKTKDVVERRELAARSHYYGQSFNETQTITTERKLVVLMSWLEAQEKHIEKYRQFYLERGFDVLNVKTSSLDLLLPTRGAKKISQDFIRFMIEKEYTDVVYHGFSVGGYMFGQVLLDSDQCEAQIRDRLRGSIRGLIFDSLVPFEGICVGVANSITQNQYAAKLIENFLKLYLVLGQKIATKYYEESSKKVWGGPLKCPSLFFCSKDDNISDYRIVTKLIDTWKNLGIETHKMTVESSPHVQIFLKHHDAYVEQAEQFLRRIKLL